MTKPTILISKMGAVACTTEYTKKRHAALSSAGEQGTTDAVVAHLLARGDVRVAYFGQWRGDVPDGLTYVQSNIKGFNDLSTSKEQKERWRDDLEQIMPLEPKTYVTIAGYASTRCVVDNPAAAAVQACAVRYTAPVLNVLQSCKLPRIVVVNDIRNYPREGEMSHGWDWARPRALLSQRTKEWSRVVLGVRWNVREVYSAAEHWRKFTRLLTCEKTLPVVVVGHAHMLDGKRLKNYDAAWRTILAPEKDVETLKRMGMRVYGKGWEHFSGYDPEYMMGVVTPGKISEILTKSATCPATVTGGELYTNKGRFCLAQRCLPLFYGRGEPYTYDPLGVQLPLDFDYRISKPGDLLRLVTYFNENGVARDKIVDSLWRATEPDYSLLDECVDDVLKGRDTGTEEWHQKYGGYRRG